MLRVIALVLSLSFSQQLAPQARVSTASSCRHREPSRRSAAPTAAAHAAEDAKDVVVALGCFWLPQSNLLAIPGVRCVTAGYAISVGDNDGGGSHSPSFNDIGPFCEALRVTYLPDAVDDAFFTALLASNPKFRPTPAKPRYRAAILYSEEAQRAAALQAVRAASAESYVTVDELASFVVAEDRHQGRAERILAALASASPAKAG